MDQAIQIATSQQAGKVMLCSLEAKGWEELGKLACVSKPVLLKRGPSATVKEWLLAAEYLLAGGNTNVVLCERGIKTFETATRNTLDLAAVALVKELSHLPVLADPSHGTGMRSLITPMSKAAVAAGADGLLIEVHPCPERALSDGPQSLDLPGFEELMKNLEPQMNADKRRSEREKRAA
jgi:3-deoxy-7-phosphoheptulonate synthase